MTENRDLIARNRRLIAAEIELFGASAEGAHVLRLAGVVAAVNPAAPDRSSFNWCIGESGEALLATHDELLRRYREAGVARGASGSTGRRMDRARARGPGGHGAALVRLPHPSYRAYLAFDGERPVSSVLTWTRQKATAASRALQTCRSLAAAASRRGCSAPRCERRVRAAQRPRPCRPARRARRCTSGSGIGISAR